MILDGIKVLLHIDTEIGVDTEPDRQTDRDGDVHRAGYSETGI